jgi:hypothetical protein
MIPNQDAALWARHNLQPGDTCPYCGGLLALFQKRSLLTLFKRRMWLGCGSGACNFAIRLIRLDK